MGLQLAMSAELVKNMGIDVFGTYSRAAYLFRIEFELMHKRHQNIEALEAYRDYVETLPHDSIIFYVFDPEVKYFYLSSVSVQDVVDEGESFGEIFNFPNSFLDEKFARPM